eukprot:CAMPEP_0167777298 /NCGR_PEP_ID=MMETSP0111_2-20121227/3615_1 /TAXON_ID=91324 /ORGANISM="Lotharella globosa, Strain CCCM811" /LENGTH=95 /DNA_ID=CAMNT_0007667465 /DNA_START=22 /DNA_END=309 /DNA_ORIENTATION=-
MRSARAVLRVLRRPLQTPTMQFTAVRGLSTSANKKKTPEELIAEAPIIEVDGTVAICTGYSPTSTHPTEYIQLNTVKNEPAVCKYCGLRFIMKKH